MQTEENKLSCFVVMGFGRKTDFETNRVLDLDKSYHNMIKPAVEAAGLACIRADEIVHSGLIDVPMYEQLLKADVVIADLSTSNKNAFYELGIRHALRPFSTIIIAEDGIKTFPFDINHVAVRQYHHLGEDIGFDEVMRFRTMLTDTVRTIVARQPEEKGDSPVYAFLKDLSPPALAAQVQAALQNAEGALSAALDSGKTAAPPDGEAMERSHSSLMAEVEEAQKRGDWITAKALLAAIRNMARNAAQQRKAGATVESAFEAKEDHYLLQRLAQATYKSKSPTEKDALIEAHHLLELLSPHTSNELETLAQWASVHKRLWQIEHNPADLDEAINATQRGYFLANDYYNGINYAFLLNVRAAQSEDADEALADKILARRVRKHVLEICNQWLQDNPEPQGADASEWMLNEYRSRWYWIMATIGEAYVGLGDEAAAAPVLEEAHGKAPEAWMKESTEEQLEKLRGLLGA